MILKFTATEAGTSVKDEKVQSVGLSCGEQYLLFSRSTNELGDWGIYLEYSDQIYSGYECVRSCLVTPNSIEIKLLTPLGQLNNVDGFFVSMEFPEQEIEQITLDLQYLFRGKEELIKIDA